MNGRHVGVCDLCCVMEYCCMNQEAMILLDGEALKACTYRIKVETIIFYMEPPNRQFKDL